VDRFSQAELAERAGVSEGEIDRLLELGVLSPEDASSPYTLGDVKRVRLVTACERAGLPLEGIASAIRQGKLSLAFLDQAQFRWSGRSERTYADLAAELGIPLEFVLAAQEALGTARPDPSDTCRDDDADILAVFPPVSAVGVPDHVLLATLRVWAEGLLRMARAETQVYHEYYEMPLLRSGLPQRQMLEIATQMSESIAELLERGVLATYRRQQEHTWIEDIIEHIEASLEEAGLRRRLVRPPAMSFLDLAGFTRLTEERGDEAAAAMAGRLLSFVQGSSQAHGGRPVKWLGDGVMCYFQDPHGAVVSALDVVEGTDEAGLPPAHVGIDAGPIVQQEGDYFGRTVNMASRISSFAQGGEVLVSQEAVDAAGGVGVRYEPVGPVMLEGVDHAVALLRAERA
jgi:adenylate cyclase